jgi:hypothetical protein
MKVCSKCEKDYPAPLEDFFNKKSDTQDGYQRHCKQCIAEWHKEHYKKRTSYYKKKARKHNKEYKVRNLQFMVDYLKEHPCVDCGEKDPIVLEFDHRSDKDCNVSTMGTLSLDRVQEEIAKCDVRCANCHRRKTAKQLNWYERIIL